MVCIRQVIEDSKIDAENAHGGNSDGDSRDNPMYFWRSSPTKHKEADWHKSAFNAGEVEAGFGRRR